MSQDLLAPFSTRTHISNCEPITSKQLKSAKPTAVFIRIFDESFKNYYTNIIQEIERLAAYQTPLQYMHNFTIDIKNLYYYNDDCTSVRAEV